MRRDRGFTYLQICVRRGCRETALTLFDHVMPGTGLCEEHRRELAAGCVPPSPTPPPEDP